MAQVRSPDVVIVGAGAVGAACAYHLAAAAMRVTVLEQDRVAAGSTTCASGGMYSISGDFDDADYLRWAVQGHYSTKATVPIIEDLSGVETGLQCRPALRLTLDEAGETQVKADLAWQSQVLNARWLTADEVRSIEPRISPVVRGAALESEAIQVPADLLAQAFMRSAQRFGATLVPAVATDLERSGARVTGVRHRQGTIACGTVVLAMGATTAATGSSTRTRRSPIRTRRRRPPLVPSCSREPSRSCPPSNSRRSHNRSPASGRTRPTPGRSSAECPAATMSYGFHSSHAALALIHLTCGPITLTLPHQQTA